jgi:small subunit ribosomal protein S2
MSSQPNVSETLDQTPDALSNVVNPLKYPDFFGVAKLFTVKDLFDAKVHLGHREGSLNDHMRPYIFGSRLGHYIIDLDLTAVHLRQALNVTAHIAFREGIILFLNRGVQTMNVVERTAKECGEYALCRVYRRGAIINSTQQFGTITRLPDLFIFLNTHHTTFEQHLGVLDAAKMLIPSIGVVDTTADPRLITYPVPGNDDSVSAIELYCRLFKEAILKGKNKRKELEASGTPFVG